MPLPIRNEETVASTEGILERSQNIKSPKLPNIPKRESKVTIARIQNFTCPACQELLKEAISINGKVRGWCGNTHTYITKEV